MEPEQTIANRRKKEPEPNEFWVLAAMLFRFLAWCGAALIPIAIIDDVIRAQSDMPTHDLWAGGLMCGVLFLILYLISDRLANVHPSPETKKNWKIAGIVAVSLMVLYFIASQFRYEYVDWRHAAMKRIDHWTGEIEIVMPEDD